MVFYYCVFTFGINTKFVKTLVILLILWYNRNVVGY